FSPSKSEPGSSQRFLSLSFCWCLLSECPTFVFVAIRVTTSEAWRLRKHFRCQLHRASCMDEAGDEIVGRAHLATSTAQRSTVRNPSLAFFFSSRRRHTRSDRDWSSDVCSSDLFLTIIIGMGVIFELPIIVMFLALMGIVDAGWLWRNLRYSILVIFVIAAIVTPTTDILHMCIFAAPMIVLYLFSIGLAWLVHPKRRKAREAKS